MRAGKGSPKGDWSPDPRLCVCKGSEQVGARPRPDTEEDGEQMRAQREEEVRQEAELMGFIGSCKPLPLRHREAMKP